MRVPRLSALPTRFVRLYNSIKTPLENKDNNYIAKNLYSKIKATGPITLAEYMREVLISPIGGYYMHKEVIGKGGDFITSPELSQMFGEMIAIWCLNEWSKMGSPKPFQFVELGPGRGSLSSDILRVFKRFESLRESSVSLVEVSSHYSEVQAKTLCSNSSNVKDLSYTFYKEGVSHDDIPIKWYRKFDDVPRMFSIVLAHEYFDALPIHQFRKTDEGYREVLIDNGQVEGSFRYVIARNETPASKAYIKSIESKECVEVSPESLLNVKSIANRLKSHGGLALICDYGHLGDGGDTFRAFKNHKLHDPLVEPGTADLTADVNFGALKEVALERNEVLAFGPTTQRNFLLGMGIEHRFKKLESTATADELKALKFSYDMILSEEKMGNCFKVMCLLPAVMKEILQKYPPVGFQ